MNLLYVPLSAMSNFDRQQPESLNFSTDFYNILYIIERKFCVLIKAVTIQVFTIIKVRLYFTLYFTNLNLSKFTIKISTYAFQILAGRKVKI